MHEHPIGATSWKLDSVIEILKMKGVKTVVGDQCQFGLETKGVEGRNTPARKRIRFMSNSSDILNELGRLCPGDHDHQHLVNGRAEKAAVYPDGLCRAICRGLSKEIDIEKRKIKPILGLSALDRVGEIPESEEESQCWKSAWDDVSGKELDPKRSQSGESPGDTARQPEKGLAKGAPSRSHSTRL